MSVEFQFPRADNTTACLSRAGFRNAAPSSPLNTNVGKITGSHIPQPLSESTSHHETSLEPKSLQNLEILSAMGDDREVKRKVGWRRKQLLPLPNLVFLLKALISTLYIVRNRNYFIFLCPGKRWMKKPYPPLLLQIIYSVPASFAGKLKQHLLLGCRILCKDNCHSQH